MRQLIASFVLLSNKKVGIWCSIPANQVLLVPASEYPISILLCGGFQNRETAAVMRK